MGACGSKKKVSMPKKIPKKESITENVTAPKIVQKKESVVVSKLASIPVLK